jgi:hypothetical protein
LGPLASFIEERFLLESALARYILPLARNVAFVG